MSDLEWLQAEAERQGLELSEDDLEFIQQRLEATRSALAKMRPAQTEGLESPHYFAPKPKKQG
jgi:hypothetical protein